MLTEIGRVVAVDEDAVWVETARQSACGSCVARSGCGHSLLAGIGRSPSLVRALLAPGSPGDIALHDEVRISLPEGSFLRGVAFLYLLPLAATLLAAGGASLWLADAGLSQGELDLAVTLAALSGLGAGLSLLRLRSRGEVRNPRVHPIVTARL